MEIRTNKLLPVAVVGLLVTVVLIFVMRDGDEKVVPAGPEMKAVPLPAADPGADADTPAETLNTVVGGYRRMEKELAQLRAENDRLRTENDKVRDIESRLSDQVERDTQRAAQRIRDQIAADQQRAQSQQAAAASTVNSGSSDPRYGAGRAEPAGNGMATIILPAGYRMEQGKDGSRSIVRTAPAPVATGAKTGATKLEDPDVPFYTIPENATLTGATAMTAVVGRVPVDGKVTDPMQFKVILGPENLATNGHYLPPNLSGIVVSGIAVGDMTLSCSEGFIQSLTFVFADGTIQTVSERKKGESTTTVGSGGTGKRLGYISDQYGNPCVRGKFVTNAPAYLTDIVGLKTLSLAGEAAAAAQTTTTNSALTGTTSTTVTGSTGKYVLGQAISGGVDEVTNWILRRMENSFDAVVTPAGASIVIHIEQEIPIDKKGDARRIDYGRPDVASNATGDNYYGMH